MHGAVERVACCRVGRSSLECDGRHGAGKVPGRHPEGRAFGCHWTPLRRSGGPWWSRRGMTAWMDYRSPYQRVASAGYGVRAVLGVHDRCDLALLEVAPLRQAAE